MKEGKKSIELAWFHHGYMGGDLLSMNLYLCTEYVKLVLGGAPDMIRMTLSGKRVAGGKLLSRKKMSSPFNPICRENEKFWYYKIHDRQLHKRMVNESIFGEVVEGSLAAHRGFNLMFNKVQVGQRAWLKVEEI